MRILAPAVALLSAVACGMPASAPSAAPAAPAAARPSSALSVSGPPTVLPAPVGATPFHLAAGGEQLRLFRLGSEAFVTVGCDSGGPFASARLAEPGIEVSTALTEGFSRCIFCMCAFRGSYPDRIYRAAPRSGPPDGCTTQVLHHKRGKDWKEVGGPGGGTLLVSDWSNGRQVVAGQDCGGTLGLAVLDKSGRVVRPKDAPSVESLLPVQGTYPGQLVGLAAFDSGEVLLLLGAASETSPRLAVWRDGRRRPSTFELPAGAGELGEAQMVALGPNEVFVGTTRREQAYLARFDGKVWVEQTANGPRTIDLVRAAADGGLWIAGEDPRLWHRSDSGAWTSFLLPPKFHVAELVELAPGDLWIASGDALYRNRPAKPVKIASDCPGVFEDGAGESLERCKPRLEPVAAQ